MAEGRDRSVTWPQVGAMIAAIAGIAAGHAYFVVPRVVQEARVEWCKDIDAATSVLRAERSLANDGISQRLNAIEQRGVRLEDKVDRLLDAKK